jgi:hypothetical protein
MGQKIKFQLYAPVLNILYYGSINNIAAIKWGTRSMHVCCGGRAVCN